MTRSAWIGRAFATEERAELDAALRQALPGFPRKTVKVLAQAIDELIDERNKLMHRFYSALHDTPAQFERIENAAREFAAAVGAVRDRHSRDRIVLEQWVVIGKTEFPWWPRTADAARWAHVTAVALEQWRKREVEATRRRGAPPGGSSGPMARAVDWFAGEIARRYLFVTKTRPTATNAAFVAVLDAACAAARIVEVPKRKRLTRLLERWSTVGEAPASGRPRKRVRKSPK
jgi:hypothetical protein